MAIVFNINIERNPNSILDVDIQILTEGSGILLTQSGFQIVAG